MMLLQVSTLDTAKKLLLIAKLGGSGHLEVKTSREGVDCAVGSEPVGYDSAIITPLVAKD